MYKEYRTQHYDRAMVSYTPFSLVTSCFINCSESQKSRLKYGDKYDHNSISTTDETKSLKTLQILFSFWFV